ncbi:hypothetical protein [Marinobacterium sp. BA1]|uniref:hypothetical protein n=1 Tax=Marinobacterium sp. BA1 TaxID=3138931 RepID=UPI0032E6016B
MSILETVEAGNNAARNGGNNGPRGVRRDAVVEVMGFDLEKGFAHVKEDQREFLVKIRNDAWVPNEAEMEEKPKFIGAIIDKRMAANIEVGDKVILERMIDFGQDIESGKPQLCDWITKAPVDEAKLRVGIMSMRGFKTNDEKGNIEYVINKTFTSTEGQARTMYGRVFMWHDQAFDNSKVDALAQRLDANNEKILSQRAEREQNPDAKFPVEPTPAFSLRCLNPNNEVLAFTMVVDWNKVTKLPPSGADLKELMEHYTHEWSQKFGEVRVEVAMAQAYQPSQNFDMKNPTPAPMIGSSADGKFAMRAAPAVLVLSTGKYNGKGQLEGAEHFWANKAFASAKNEHLHTLIANTEGIRPTLAEGMGLEVVSPFQSRVSQATKNDQAHQQSPANGAQAEQSGNPQAPQQAQNPAPAAAVDAEDAMLNDALAAAQQRASASPSNG